MAEAGDARGLVERAAVGDPDAWEELYRRTYPRLFGYCRRRLPSDAAAEDAVSETVARSMRAIHRFTGQRAGLDAWLFGIARNVVLETVRVHDRGSVLPEATAPEEPDPPQRTVGGDEGARMRHAFELLSSSDREVVELWVVGGLTVEEVGVILDRAPGAVRMAQSRALQRLRAILGEEVDA